MKLLSIAFTIIAASVVSIAPASAQVAAGMQEVALTGSFDRGNHEFGARTTRIEADARYGFFATDRFSFGPEVSFFKQQQEAEWAVSGFATLHVGDTSSRLVPYLNGAYGQVFGSAIYSESPTFVSVGPGLKLFAGDGGGALDIAGFYRRVFLEGGSRFPIARDEFGIKVGVAIYFRR